MLEQEATKERSIERFDPFADLDRLRERLGEWAANWRTAPWMEPFDGGFVPPADVEEDDDAWTIEVELPGVKKQDIDIEIVGRRLQISGERKEKERTGILRQKTRVTGSFRYEITLPSDVDADAVEASLDDGELTVRLPKAERAERRAISIG